MSVKCVEGFKRVYDLDLDVCIDMAKKQLKKRYNTSSVTMLALEIWRNNSHLEEVK